MGPSSIACYYYEYNVSTVILQAWSGYRRPWVNNYASGWVGNNRTIMLDKEIRTLTLICLLVKSVDLDVKVQSISPTCC